MTDDASEEAAWQDLVAHYATPAAGDGTPAPWPTNQRLERDRSVAVGQSGKRHHRVDCAVRRVALRALYEVHVHHLVRHEALEIERDAHAVSRERTPE